MKTESEIQQFVRLFEEGKWPTNRWHHYEHLVMAVWYIDRYPLQEAIEKIRSGILRHNEANGILQTEDDGYHETVTIFLARFIAKKLDSVDSEMDLTQKIEKIKSCCSDFKSKILEYYSQEKIQSWDARTQWVSPDLKAL